MLTQAHWETLEAAVNRIIPSDDCPGGWQAGVGEYLARQFDGGDLQARVPEYRIGLEALEREAETLRGAYFGGLPWEQQDDVLARVERGDVAAEWLIDPTRFFQTLVGHAMEGFYADPGNGGNRDGAAWRMIGFEVRG